MGRRSDGVNLDGGGHAALSPQQLGLWDSLPESCPACPSCCAPTAHHSAPTATA